MEQTRVLLASASTDHPVMATLEGEFDVTHVDSVEDLRARLDDTVPEGIVLGRDLEDGDWRDALAVIERTFFDVPVVLCPSDGDEYLASDALAAGATDYIPADEAEESIVSRLESVVNTDPFDTGGPFRALAESATDAIVAMDADGKIRFANDALERVLGYEPEAVLGESLTILMPEHLRGRHREGLRQYLETGERSLDWERIHLPGLHKSGEERSLEITFSEFDHGGEHFFVGILRDITEQERQQEQLERYNEQLEELIAALSHDLRTPLNVAKGRVDLASRSAENEETTADLETATDALDQMETMIEDLLALAQQGRAVAEPEPISLTEAVDAAWGMAETGDLELVRSDHLGEIEADRTRVIELLQNLFTNAAIHAEGATSIRVGRLEREDGFYVADDGPGVPPDERERVFEPGFTTSDEGTGFGLAIVRRIAEAHGWSVDLRASDEGGARFEFRFE